VIARKSLVEVIVPVRQYLRGELSAFALGKIVDDLVSQNLLSELDPAAVAAVEKLQLALALYVPDQITRREEPNAFIGPVELLERVKEFDAEARRLGH
jgi:hypothetical protein